MSSLQANKQQAWIIKLKESNDLIFGEITSEYRTNANKVEDLVLEDKIEEYDRWEEFLKEAIVSITPNQNIILNTKGYVPYEVDYNRSWIIKVFDEFVVGVYHDLAVNFLKAIFQIKNQKFLNHRNKLIRYNGRENNKAFLREIQNDDIPILKDDEEGGYYIKLHKSQLKKYLFNELIGSKAEIIALPLVADHLLTEFDLNFLAYPGIHYWLDKNQLAVMRSIMQDHLMIGTYIEEVYYFVAQKSLKNQIINQLNNFAKTKNLTISWE